MCGRGHQDNLVLAAGRHSTWLPGSSTVRPAWPTEGDEHLPEDIIATVLASAKLDYAITGPRRLSHLADVTLLGRVVKGACAAGLVSSARQDNAAHRRDAFGRRHPRRGGRSRQHPTGLADELGGAFRRTDGAVVRLRGRLAHVGRPRVHRENPRRGN